MYHRVAECYLLDKRIIPIKLVIKVESPFKVVAFYRSWHSPLELYTALWRGCWCATRNLGNFVTEFPGVSCTSELMTKAQFRAAARVSIEVHVVADNVATECRESDTASLPTWRAYSQLKHQILNYWNNQLTWLLLYQHRSDHFLLHPHQREHWEDWWDRPQWCQSPAEWSRYQWTHE